MLLPLLALLPGLAWWGVGAAPALVLTLLEGAVAQVLLLVDHVAEIVELLHHLAEVVAVHVRRRHLQVFHHLLELLQQLARGVLGAAARHALQAVEHVLEILLAQHARIAVERTGELLIVLELLLHRLHEAVHGGAQLVHQLLELLVAGAAVERVAQRFLRGAQGRLRFGNIAVLQADRHRPQPRRYLAQGVVALGAHQRPEDRAQPEIDAGLGPEFVRPEGERIDRGDDLRTGAGVEREITPLLDQRLRQRFGERALGQTEGERLAPALVAAFIARRERHDHLGAGPGMIGHVLDGLRDAALGARLRQDQREIGRPVQRMRAVALRRRHVLAGEGRVRFGRAVVVLDAVGQEHRAAVLLLRVLGQRDRRRLVGSGVERPGQVVADAAQGRCPGGGDLEAVLLGAARGVRRLVDGGHAAAAGDVEVELAGGAPTRVLPAGTVTGSPAASAARAVSPGWMPARMIGGLPV